MITPEEFKTMQTAARCLIEVVFEYESEFKDEFITPYTTYKQEDYELHRAHISGNTLRVQVRFEDYSDKDMYFDLASVIQWYQDLAVKIKGV